MQNTKQLKQKVIDKNSVIVVVGLGYVGLPLAAAFAAKYDTIGFDVNESKDMLEESRDLVAKILDHGRRHTAEWGFADSKVRDTLNRFYYEHTKRRPMILPVMVKV